MWEAFPNVYLAFFVLFKGDTVDLTVGAFSSKKREATAIGRQLVNPFCIRSWGGEFRRVGGCFDVMAIIFHTARERRSNTTNRNFAKSTQECYQNEYWQQCEH